MREMCECCGVKVVKLESTKVNEVNTVCRNRVCEMFNILIVEEKE